MPRKKATSKRANNEGSVYKNKRGLWVAQATIGYDENGKQIRKAVSGKTRAEAIANLAPYLPKRRPQTVDTTGYVSPKSYAILVDEVQKANNRATHI